LSLKPELYNKTISRKKKMKKPPKELTCLSTWELWIKGLRETRKEEMQAHPINCFNIHAERL
jgi:hypothetical protein